MWVVKRDIEMPLWDTFIDSNIENSTQTSSRQYLKVSQYSIPQTEQLCGDIQLASFAMQRTLTKYQFHSFNRTTEKRKCCSATGEEKKDRWNFQTNLYKRTEQEMKRTQIEVTLVYKSGDNQINMSRCCAVLCCNYPLSLFTTDN